MYVYDSLTHKGAVAGTAAKDGEDFYVLDRGRYESLAMLATRMQRWVRLQFSSTRAPLACQCMLYTESHPSKRYVLDVNIPLTACVKRIVARAAALPLLCACVQGAALERHRGVHGLGVKRVPLRPGKAIHTAHRKPAH